jgi:hypothetical protein
LSFKRCDIEFKAETQKLEEYKRNAFTPKHLSAGEGDTYSPSINQISSERFFFGIIEHLPHSDANNAR